MSARDAREPAKEPAERRRGPDELEDSSWEKFKANMRTIGGAVLLAIFIRIVLFEAFEIDGPSMEPTLQHGDRVVVAKMLYGLFLPYTHEAVMTWGSPHLGDVVIVNSPADGVDIVKRVIGVAGDTIEIRDGRILRNGDAVPHEEMDHPYHRRRHLWLGQDPCAHRTQQALQAGGQCCCRLVAERLQLRRHAELRVILPVFAVERQHLGCIKSL